MIKNKYTSGIIQYIPFFYVIWSDDLLSASEINIVKNAIEKDTTLSKDDSVILLGWLNKASKPSNKEIKYWKNTISNAAIKLIESEIHPLTSFSQRLTAFYFDESSENEQLQHIEINLGIKTDLYSKCYKLQLFI